MDRAAIPARGGTAMTTQLSPVDAPVTDRADATQRATLSRIDREELFVLLDRYFAGVTAEQFARDLEEKDWVLRVRRGERLVGFSTLAVSRTMVDGKPLNVVY